MTHRNLTLALPLALLGCMALGLPAQSPATHSAAVDRAAAGSAPSHPGPLATDLSAQLDSKDIQKAMRKVADWQLRVAQPDFNRQWTFAALYDGLLAASDTTGDPQYRDAVANAAANKFHWQLDPSRFPHADDEALGKTDLSLFSQEQLDDIAWRLNTRPRKTLGWKAPAELFLPEGAFDFVQHWSQKIPVALVP